MAGLSRITTRLGAIIARGTTGSAHRCSPRRCAPRRKHSTRRAYSIQAFSLTHDVQAGLTDRQRSVDDAVLRGQLLVRVSAEHIFPSCPPSFREGGFVGCVDRVPSTLGIRRVPAIWRHRGRRAAAPAFEDGWKETLPCPPPSPRRRRAALGNRRSHRT